jgi:hypothetical protein
MIFLGARRARKQGESVDGQSCHSASLVIDGTTFAESLTTHGVNTQRKVLFVHRHSSALLKSDQLSASALLIIFDKRQHVLVRHGDVQEIGPVTRGIPKHLSRFGRVS